MQTSFRCLALVAGMLLSAVPQSVVAQDSTSREVVQPLPSPEVQRLNRALMELARRPSQLNSLLEAGDASLAVDDHDAALGFYGRAAEVSENDPRVKLGLARVYLRSGRPVEAIPLLNAARSAGAPARDVLSDQALAFDLVGDQESARSAYARAIELNPQDDETRRRLALSHAISGDEDSFQSTLAPLIEGRDFAAFRAQAFGLAILGQQERAEGIVNTVMPRDLATRINPYLAYMPRLTSAQQAAAANLGIFPRAADIGREDPRIARFAREGTVGSRLEPTGDPLGTSPEAALATASQEVVQTAPEPAIRETAATSVPQQPQSTASQTVAAASVESVSESEASRQPGFNLSRANKRSETVPESDVSLPEIATTQVAESQPSESEPDFANVDDAFAEFGTGEMPIASDTAQAVDLSAIEIRRDASPESTSEPAQPTHPRRIWVQLATGRDVNALKFDWRRFARRAPDLLGEFEPHITPWGQANRLLAGPIDSRADARALVNGLAEKGIETFSYSSPEGTEIQELR